MSDDINDLSDLLGDDKPTLSGTLGKMDTQHFTEVVNAVEAELLKRRAPDVANMTDGQFQAYKNALMK